MKLRAIAAGLALATAGAVAAWISWWDEPSADIVPAPSLPAAAIPADAAAVVVGVLAPDAAVEQAAPAPVQITHVSPRGIAETCQLLVAFPFTPADVVRDPEQQRWYHRSDVAAIEKLCAIDLYLNAGVCPKTHYSTPALEIYDLEREGLTKQAFERQRCGRDRKQRGATKRAKLKVPAYHREPESGLLYFHLSRILGNAGFVYPATYRTVDRDELMKWRSAAFRSIEALATSYNPKGGWFRLQRHAAGPDSVGGSLAKNPRGETPHRALGYFDDGGTPLTNTYAYRTRGYYKLVASEPPIAEQFTFEGVEPAKFQTLVQSFAHAQDFTHLVIMDHLLGQQDRAGNIHAEVYDHYLDEHGHLRWAKAGTAPQPALALERLLLKDNDDGLVWPSDNRGYSSELVAELRHLDTLTYERLLWLAGLMSDPDTRDTVATYFRDAVHVSDAAYQSVRKRVVALAETLQRARAAGRLHLDLDLELALAKRVP